MSKERIKVRSINDPVFDKFLKDHRVKGAFIKNCNDPKVNYYTYNDAESLPAYLLKIESDDVSPSIFWDSFVWAESLEGHIFWYELNNSFHLIKNE